MIRFSKDPTANDASFLPDDYVERKTERRTNLISVTLFVIVTMGVIGAFFVTNRQWNDVKTYQQAINVRYTQAAKDIEQLKVLEGQKKDLLSKAELTTALIEKVPRSILLAELINRMPKRVVLLEFEMESTRIKPATVKRSVKKSRSLAKKKGSDTKDPVTTKIEAPRFSTELIILGVAPSHQDVSRYLGALKDCQLLNSVEVKFSERTFIKDTEMIKFRIEADLRRDADARAIVPLENPRLVSLDEAVAPDPEELLNGSETVNVPAWEEDR